MDIALITNKGIKLIEGTELENLIIQHYNEIKTAYATKEKNLITYFSELNGKSVIPDNDNNPENAWRTNFRSSLFHQKIIFAYLLLRSLLYQTQLSELYTIETEDPALASAFNKIAKTYFQKTNALDALDKAIFYSLLSGFYLIRVDNETRIDEFGDVESDIVVEAINPLFVKLTSDEMSFVIERYVPLTYAQALINLGVWRPVENLEPYNIASPKDQTDHHITTPPRKKTVKVSEIYTRLLLDDNSLTEFYKFTILNDRHLVSEEVVNHYDKRPPFIFTWFYGTDIQQSYADLIFEYYKEDTRLTRLLIDLAIISSATGIEVDITNLDETDEISIFTPFTVIKKKSPEEAIRNFTLGNFNPNILPIRQLILQEAQNITGITEFLMGMPTSKGRPTAKEVLIKTQMSLQSISTIVRRIEDVVIKQLIRKLISLALQFQYDEVVKLLSPQEIKALENLIKEGLLKGKVKDEKDGIKYVIKQVYKGTTIRVGGLTETLNKMEELEKLIQFVGIYAQYGLTFLLNMPEITKAILNKLNIPVNYAIELTPEMWTQLLQMQLLSIQNQNKGGQSNESGSSDNN